MDWKVLAGDSLEVMRGLETNSVDAVITDPPYALTAVSRGGSPRINNPETPFGRHPIGGKGFMGKTWDASIPGPEYWAEALRIAKPGAHLLAFGGTRTFHRLYCAIEDAGWEIRDTIGNLETLLWVYGSGFPKSLNVSRVAENAKQWRGWGTALKPSFEPIVLARKPLEGTVVQNVLKYGTGAINIDECRIGINGGDSIYAKNPHTDGTIGAQGIYGSGRVTRYTVSSGRWPANLTLTHHENCVQRGTKTIKGDKREELHGQREGGFYDIGANKGDGVPNSPVYGNEIVENWDCARDEAGNYICPVAMLNEQSGKCPVSGSAILGKSSEKESEGVFGHRKQGQLHNDIGGASRFFYCAKASTSERNAGLQSRNKHPTVKPIELMKWLITLVTPPNGVILDPFCGSGSTGIAALQLKCSFVGIDNDPESVEIAKQRLAYEEEQIKENEPVSGDLTDFLANLGLEEE